MPLGAHGVWVVGAIGAALVGCGGRPPTGAPSDAAADTEDRPPPSDGAAGDSPVDAGIDRIADTGDTAARDDDAAGDASVDTPVDVARPVCPMMPGDLLSDFATDNGISPVNGRGGGGWYPSADMTADPNGRFDPPAPADGGYPIDPTTGNPYCSGPGSLHTKATGFATLGAALATDFVPRVSNGLKGAYDAGAYRGVAFWARAAAPIKYVRVTFPDSSTDPHVQDPACAPAPGFPNNCSPYMVKLGDGDFPKYITTTIDTTWRRFEILFADAAQDRYNPGYHRAPPNDQVDVHHLLGVAIEVTADFSTSPTRANDFEIWIDDVELVR